jgi:hypothetical protein
MRVPAMELSGLLSNRDLCTMLKRLEEALPGAPTTRPTDSTEFRPPQGQVTRAIKAVLREHPDGLRTTEVRSLVEDRLRRTLSRSTVKGILANNTRADRPFERMERGLYRLKQSN